MNVSNESIQPLRDAQVYTNKLHYLTSMHLVWTTKAFYIESNILRSNLFAAYLLIKIFLTAVGHNLGAEHPFYDQEIVKQGQIGGLMDYGLYVQWQRIHHDNYSLRLTPLTRADNNEWDGAIQFGTFNRNRVCLMLEVL